MSGNGIWKSDHKNYRSADKIEAVMHISVIVSNAQFTRHRATVAWSIAHDYGYGSKPHRKSAVVAAADKLNLVKGEIAQAMRTFPKAVREGAMLEAHAVKRLNVLRSIARDYAP